eukprot:jgi/Mesvir1/16856/Mv15743-RA.2
MGSGPIITALVPRAIAINLVYYDLLPRWLRGRSNLCFYRVITLFKNGSLLPVKMSRRRKFDYLVIGCGVAGMNYALGVADHGTVAILEKGKHSSISVSTHMSERGGIAAVMDTKEDSFESHIEDTLKAGQGLCNREVVEAVVREVPHHVQRLIELGARFERDPATGQLALAQELAHSHRRVIFSGAGTNTGREVERALLVKVKEHPNITVFEQHVAVDLLTEHHLGQYVSRLRPDLHCFGAYVYDECSDVVVTFLAKATMLATGGCGQVYLQSTNSPMATGDGVAMAFRAKARIANMEFVQFHPTIFHHHGISTAPQDDTGRLRRSGEEARPSADSMSRGDGSKGPGHAATASGHGAGGHASADGHAGQTSSTEGEGEGREDAKGGDERPLVMIPEPVRVYGAVLLNLQGERFMPQYDDRAELAPRDIVARAIDDQMKQKGQECVLLDLTMKDARETIARFPGLYEVLLRSYGLDITKKPIPVVPAAHYQCGGVKTDAKARTSIKGLFACGEVACTGLHGANRLSSNLLPEALVCSQWAIQPSVDYATSAEGAWREDVPDWDDSGTEHPAEWVLISHNQVGDDNDNEYI